MLRPYYTLGILLLSLGLLVACGSSRGYQRYEPTRGQSETTIEATRREQVQQHTEQTALEEEYIQIEEEEISDSLPRSQVRRLRTWRRHRTKVAEEASRWRACQSESLDKVEWANLREREVSVVKPKGIGRWFAPIILIGLLLLAYVGYRRIRPFLRLWEWIR